ncbi:hypothetical protein [Lacticaseibacillus parakribbianus]|uniref:hypothetical protein n=1 Tax=Lacticaseibacillus parakribbianus TaxID=2970927 RepID=UPI0021CB5C23|nr:hypothetical protein [Lacticaseibacillus parakribbianus]
MTRRDDEAQLDALQNTLHPSDRVWFSRVRLAMQALGWTRDRAAVVAQLLALAQDLQSAEAAGESAEAYFGQDPQGMTKAILRELPLRPWRFWLRGGAVVTGLGWLMMLLGAAGRQSVLALHLGAAGGMIAITVAVVALLARWAAAVAFTPGHGWWETGASLAALGGGWLAVVVALIVWQPGPAVAVPAPWNLVLIAGSCAVALGWLGWVAVRHHMLGVLAPEMLLLVMFAINALVRQFNQNRGAAMTSGQAGWLVAVLWTLLIAYLGASAWVGRRSHRVARHGSR